MFFGACHNVSWCQNISIKLGVFAMEVVTDEESSDWLNELIVSFRSVPSYCLLNGYPSGRYQRTTAHGTCLQADGSSGVSTGSGVCLRAPAEQDVPRGELAQAFACQSAEDRAPRMSDAWKVDVLRQCPDAAPSSGGNKRCLPEMLEPSSSSAGCRGSVPQLSPDICYSLTNACKAGTVLAHVRNNTISVLEKFKGRGEPVMFKFGVTSGPHHRWSNSAYGYKKERWQKMYVLHSSCEAGSVLMLEAALIALFDKEVGLQNTAPGGENPPKIMPCFLYLVVRGLALPTSG